MKKHAALLNPQLEAFMAVAEKKTVHAGARSIHISQTAMTQRILNLEQKLKTTLFIRTHHGMKLTPEGEKLLRYSQTVSAYSHETLIDMMNSGIDTIQRVKISGPSSIMISRIIPRAMLIMKAYPKLYISFDVNDTDNVISDLRNGSSQFSILRPEQVTQDMESKALAAEKYQLVCTSAWRGRKLVDILKSERIIDFDESDHTTIHYLKQFKLFCHAQVDRLYVNRTVSLSNMLIKGYGYGVLTKEFSHSLIENGDLIALNSAKTYKNYLNLAWYSRPEPPRYFQTIINQLT